MTSPRRLGAFYDVPREIAARTQTLLRERGDAGQEGYVVWVGDLQNRSGRVRDVWPVATRAGAAHARVDFHDVLELAERVHATGWFVLAQVHSHPSQAFHSHIDDAHPLSSQPGFISIVIPDFAQRGPLDGWVYYEYQDNGSWHRLNGAQLARRVRTTTGNREGWWKRRWAVITGRRSSSAR